MSMITQYNCNSILVVAAHVGDFVWRCGGTIAKYARQGVHVRVVTLSEGIRGEANDYWKRNDANTEDGKALRIREATAAAKCLLVDSFECWAVEDYPIELRKDHVEKLAHIIRGERPDIIITHDEKDRFNPDHGYTHDFVQKACACSSGKGFIDGLESGPRQIPIFCFEPHITEINGFFPMLYVDISDVFDLKCEAMNAFKSQPGMYDTYVCKAEMRGSEAAGRAGRKNCKYAEAFALATPIGASGGFVW